MVHHTFNPINSLKFVANSLKETYFKIQLMDSIHHATFETSN